MPAILPSATTSLLLGALAFLAVTELSAACFRHLTPLLEAWSQSAKEKARGKKNWENLALFVWAIGISVPLLAFSFGAYFFASTEKQASSLIIGTTMGANIVAIAVGFAFILLSGPIKFFRIRSINSPLFLLLATLAFTITSLNQTITAPEGVCLLLLAVAYVIYFRRFSTEARYHQRQTRKHANTLEPTLLAVVAVFCMAIGFFAFAVVLSNPIISFLNNVVLTSEKNFTKYSILLVALFVSAPWIVRILLSLFTSSTRRAFLVTNLTHACLFNLLILPGIIALLIPLAVSHYYIALDLPILVMVTVVFICTLLIEKERGIYFPWVLLGSYLLYSIFGLW